MAKTIIVVITAGVFAVSVALAWLALTNKASRDIEFRISHLLSYRPIDRRSRLQLLVESALGVGVGCLLVWLLWRG